MGIHHRQTTFKRRIDFYMDKNATGEKLAENRSIKTAIAAAAMTLKACNQFPDSRIREFVDDMDLRLERLLDDQDTVDDILEQLEIFIRTDSGTCAENRISIEKRDRNLCQSCTRCSREMKSAAGSYYCNALKLRFRRGRSICRSWIGSGQQLNRWQRRIMDAGGPPDHMEL